MANSIPVWFPTQFNVFGCEYSTDIDIGIQVPDKCIIEDYKQNKLQIDLEYVKNELIELGYSQDMISKIDFNLLYIDPTTLNLSQSLIGTKETQNMIFHTYNLHKQAHGPIFSNSVKISFEDKIRFFSKFVMDNAVNFLGKTKYNDDFRETKSNIYRDLISRIVFSSYILKQTNFIDLVFSDKDLTKSFCMKLSQLLLLKYDEYAYTKKSIAEKVSNLFGVKYDVGLYLLTRGLYGTIVNRDEIIKYFDTLINHYEKITETFSEQLCMSIVKYPTYDDLVQITKQNVSSDIILPNIIFNEFVKSPEIPTDALQTHINELYSKTKSLNQIFVLNTFGCENLPDALRQHIHTENQRSSEWLRLLKFYQCGNTINNTIEFKDTLTNFNLIRGCVGEKMIIDYVNWNELAQTNVSKCVCGMLVETKDLAGSRGIATDLLLICTQTQNVIPVEIKCLVSEPNVINKKFLREIVLAKKQLDTSIEIIENVLGTKTFGLIVFGFIHNSTITIGYKKYFK